MNTAMLFKTDQGQAVCLPKEYQFAGDSIYIKKLDNTVILLPSDEPWCSLISSLNEFSDYFMPSREQAEQQERDEFFK